MTTPNNKTMHDIRNCLNALRLNSAYLEQFARQDILDCMDGLIESAEKLEQIMLPLSDDAPGQPGPDDAAAAPQPPAAL